MTDDRRIRISVDRRDLDLCEGRPGADFSEWHGLAVSPPTQVKGCRNAEKKYIIHGTALSTLVLVTALLTLVAAFSLSIMWQP